MRRFLSAASALAIVLATPFHAASLPLPKLGNLGLGKEQAQSVLPAGAWPQAKSDVAADPAIRFGALPNGMRYAIRRQQIPPGQAAIRLRFDAGSMMETDQQQGLAHFLEHMAFNGSKAVPEGDMIKILERLGLAFGADTNASTNFDETIYKLDLPRTDEETIDTAVMLMRETAGNLTIDQGAVDRERGVVRSEERARDTPAYRVYKARLDFFLKGQLPPTRYPIGKVEVLQSAPASQIADFYHRYYRPERAVLVVVGDFDVDAMEAKIKSRFGDWIATGPAGTAPNLGAVKSRGAEAKLVVESGAPLSMQLAWIRAPDLTPDTLAKRKHDLVEQLGFAILNRRLQRLARGAEPPFLGAGSFVSDEYDAADLATVIVSAEPGRWREALWAAEQEQRHPDRRHVVQRHRRGQRQVAERVEPQEHRDHAGQAAPEVRGRDRGLQRHPAHARQHRDQQCADDAAVQDDLAGCVLRRRELDADAHRREQQRRQHHHPRRAQSAPFIAFRYHSWNCCMPSSIGLWYGPTSSSPRSSSARRPASMRSAISSSSAQVSQ